ncbi:MAG: single-stranded DNA-binding protein [Bacteroidetes bacterium HGW-Bacteroidetes-6]|jgi:single-strand DNA-binding protein|nr:MAG: single-stranded DNA-binding protein [Bacteroidetes bacterium HGW-Bacteroidetes-6]
MNKVELIGRMGQDPEIKTTRNGGKFAMFSLAINEGYVNGIGEYVKNTSWHRIVLWGNEFEKYEGLLKKGAQLYVTGKLNNNSYTDKDGNKRTFTQIIGELVEERQNGVSQGVV